jgi:uncharacterized protein
MVRLIPKDEKFFDLFTRTGEIIVEASRKLESMLDSYDRLDLRVAEIQALEKQGDQVDEEVARRLERSFVTPFDREDIHALTEELDDTVDEMQAAAELLVLHRVEKPLPEVLDLADVLVKAAETNVTLIAKLPRLRDVDSELEAIDQLETDADRLYRRCVAHLFSGDFKAFAVLKWKDVVESIEGSTNAIENISDIVESIVLKHA